MTHRKLASFYGTFWGKTNLVLRDFSLAPTTSLKELEGVPLEVVLKHSRSFLVNRLLHLWGEFCRHLIVASALGGYQTLSGVTLRRAPQIRSVSDILTTIQKPSIAGPGLRWDDPKWTVKTLTRIQPCNIHQITLGVGAVPYEEFCKVRNFVIHSNSYTRLGFDTVAVTYSLIGASVDDFLLHRLPGGGTVMEGWVRDFQDAALDAVR